MENVLVSVSEAIELFNQSLEYAFPVIAVEGEVGSFKVNQNKFVFFDLKDETSTLGCFMMVYALKVPLEDGMRVKVVAKPTITKWGKFSLTVQAIVPTGEGSIKRAFEVLKQSLDKEGLFDISRKRPLPALPEKIGVVSSTHAAGYADFIRIVQDRWPAVEIIVAPAVVQGALAPSSVTAALKQLNERSDAPDVIAIMRGGGSADDLAAFNDEGLVRAIAASRIPVISGIGHEVDVTLTDLVADVRAATPSNVAERIVPDKSNVMSRIDDKIDSAYKRLTLQVRDTKKQIDDDVAIMYDRLTSNYHDTRQELVQYMKLLDEYNPETVLRRGYAIMHNKNGAVIGTANRGDTIVIQTKQARLVAEVTDVEQNN